MLAPPRTSCRSTSSLLQEGPIVKPSLVLRTGLLLLTSMGRSMVVELRGDAGGGGQGMGK